MPSICVTYDSLRYTGYAMYMHAIYMPCICKAYDMAYDMVKGSMRTKIYEK